MKKLLLVLFLCSFGLFLHAQETTITGTVTDDDGLPIPGVNVTVKNSSRGTQTDFDGNYSINAAPNETLVFTFVGLSSVERAVGTQAVINVKIGRAHV